MIIKQTGSRVQMPGSESGYLLAVQTWESYLMSFCLCLKSHLSYSLLLCFLEEERDMERNQMCLGLNSSSPTSEADI